MENIEERVWTYIRERRDFVRFNEIQRALALSPQQLSRTIKRLEEGGYLFTDIRQAGHRPINEYFAIDSENGGSEARIVNDNGWLILILEWSDGKGRRKSVSMSYGELGDWLRTEKGKTVLAFPSWAERLEKVGRFTFEALFFGKAPAG